MVNPQKIAYAQTVYGQEEISAVVECLADSTQFGKRARLFESQIAAIFDKQSGLFVNSGSSALLIGMEAFDFPKGSEVITPALTFGTTVSCILKNGLRPVFVDVAPLSYCIDCSYIEEMISDKTVAILAPDLLGNICDWPAIRRLADNYGLKVIQDSADTIGAKVAKKPAGSFSDMSITSFYGSHIINCAGNGGALCLNDKSTAEKAKLLRSWGRSSSLFDGHSETIANRFNKLLDGVEYDAKFVFEIPGYNLEGSEIGAAFGLIQLTKLQGYIQERMSNFKRQYEFFLNFPEFFSNPVVSPDVETAFLAYPVMLRSDAPFSRKALQIFLEERDIQTRVCFSGNVIRQPMMQGVDYRVVSTGVPCADAVMERSVLLPVHHGMTDSMFERLHDVITDFVRLH